ncbi:TetR/AcrR family transcriptional regulator [Chondrinema litorale]|uniref:TetR/AcrR family transcriptional regulator n=1 Tax=Chondrinema litorale TaxID=2994555 RepID=UPI0025437E6D|nr:TetR/AcrR family transcriptional regulator [Chondrinema litorale]UZR97024.1 TetR/AcrR family transcriptional regulator [Chondrinema litorale]
MPRVKQFDKDEILAKAMNLFWQKGYHATSIGDLVEYTGVNRQSLYSTFTNKDELFNQAFERYRTIYLNKACDFLSTKSSAKEGIKDFFLKAIDNSLSDPEHKGCFVLNTTTEMVPENPNLMRVIAEHQQTFEKILIEFMEKGITLGEFPENIDLKSTAAFLITLYNGLVVMSKFRTEKEYLTNILDTALKVLDHPA